MTALLAPSKENTLYEVEGGFLCNGSSQHFFAGKSASRPVRRVVAAFDLAGDVPVGSTITEVTLTLNMSRTVDDAQVIAVHRMLADWGQGASDHPSNEEAKVAATTVDATWIFRVFGSDPPSEYGGDFASAPIGNILVVGPGRYAWGSTAETVDDVQMRVNSPAANFW